MAYSLYRSLNTRIGRSLKKKKDSEVDSVSIDWSKGPKDNLKEILAFIVNKEAISKDQKLNYLNLFTKFCTKIDYSFIDKLGFSLEEIFCCLRVSLFHESVEVRAAGFRAIRYLLKNDKMVKSFYNVNLHILIARSIDIDLNNKSERIQCIRLVRKLLSLKPKSMVPALARSIVAIARDGLAGPEKDVLVRASWATLAELALLNPKICYESAGIPTILDSILVANQPHNISEALIGSILYFFNDPKLRYYLRADLDLQHFLAPFTDCHYSLPFFNTHKSSDSVSETPEQKESRFNVAKNTLISILRSWPGLIYLCKANDTETKIPNGLQSLIEMLHLPYVDTPKYLMELIFELFYLTTPTWTCDFQAALLSCNSSSLQDSWHLYDGFVVAEGKHILPRLALNRQNLLDNYLSLLLYSFITYGLLDGLISLIIISNNIENSVRATILLGELLHLSSQLLPPEVFERCHSLPKLVEAAISSSNTAEQRNIARGAINCLNRMHSIKKHPVLPCSLYLDQLLQFSSIFFQKSFSYLFLSKAKLKQYLKKENNDSFFSTLIKESQVLKNEAIYWNWSLIGCILKSPSESFKKFEESSHKVFIRKLINYFKPTNKLYSQLEIGAENGQEICFIGSHLIDFLLEADETKAFEFLDEFLLDLNECFSRIITENSPFNAILSVTKMISTWSHTYFLFIGRLSKSKKGQKLLEKNGIYQNLLDLVNLASHEVYLKLIVSSLYYNQDNNFTRVIFEKILTCSVESARLYATNYIRILLRAKFLELQNWTLELLSNQLYDTNLAVVQAAIDILDEACDNPENLKTLISLRPTLLHVGDRGLLLFIRYLSIPIGFDFLKDSNFLDYEMVRWKDYFNYKYVKIIEDSLNERLSCHQRSEDGTYGRRSDRKINFKKAVITPPHLYGELAKHEKGFQFLFQENCLDPMFKIIQEGNYSNEFQILQLKAALWAIGAVGSSPLGFQLVCENDVIPLIIKLAAEASVISIRGTCFYVLGLLAFTENGANHLKKFGWETVRHSYNDKWPILKEMSNTNSENSCYSLPFHPKKFEMSQSSSRILDFWAMISSKQKSLSSLDSFVLNENSYFNSDEILGSSLEKPLSSKKIVSDKSSLISNIITNQENSHLVDPVSFNNETQFRSSSEGLHQNSFEYIDVDSSENDGLWLKNEKKETMLSDSITSFNLGNKKNKNVKNVAIYDKFTTDIKQKVLASDSQRKISELYGPQNPTLNSKVAEGFNGYQAFMLTLSESKAKLNSSLLSDDTSSNCNYIQKPQSSTDNSNDSLGTECKDLLFNPQVYSQERSLSMIGKKTSDIFDYIPSAIDSLGYATLRSIQRKRAKSLGIQFHFSGQKVKYLDDNSDQEEQEEQEEQEVPLNSFRSSFLSNKTNHVNQTSETAGLETLESKQYIGICLPVSLYLIFTTPTSHRNSDEFQNGQDDEENENKGNIESDNSELFMTNREWDLHTPNKCLLCSYKLSIKSYKALLEKPNNSISNIDDSVNHSSSNLAVLISNPKLDNYSSSVTSSNFETSIAAVQTKECNVNQILIRKEILRLVINLIGSVEAKTAEQGLLNLKQKYPQVFQDICLYSEISLQLASYNFRLPARRFLQELFFDINFDQLYPDVNTVAIESFSDNSSDYQYTLNEQSTHRYNINNDL